MSTTTALARRTILGVLAYLCCIPWLYAQNQKSFGADTKPYTVVYKLLPQQANARTTGKGMQEALRRIGAEGIRQKFTDAAPANARKAGPAVDLSQIYELQYRPEMSLEQVRSTLMATGMVAYVEPLYQREPFHQPTDPSSDSTSTRQHYLKRISAYQGWAAEKGDSTIVIGILDTGFRLSHEDLKKKHKRNYNDLPDGIDNDGDDLVDNYLGWDFANNDNDVTDDTKWKGHGTGVAAVAAGATDNAIGMASVGYKTMFMPLKVFPSASGGSFAGYEAIVYAANNGCHVINLSWGGTGFSQFEQDVINYAVLEKNVVIVASAGNTNAHLDFYPASYENVISVGGTDPNDIKYKDYTYSYKIDIAAPSTNIYTASITNDNSYGGAWGTSFGSPIVAGSAALVRKKYPQLNARQVMERLRVTADQIYTLPGNQAYLEMLGSGRINLKKALRQQGLQSLRCTAFNLSGKYLPAAGAEETILATFTNFLEPVSNAAVTLTTSSPYITIEQGQFSLGSLGTMGTANNHLAPFRFKVAENTPINEPVVFRLTYRAGDYVDYQNFEIRVNPDYVTLDANNLVVTLNSKGNLGYNGFNFNQGMGVRYKEGESMIFEGGLMIASAPTKVSDNLRDDIWVNDGDFTPVSTAKKHLNTPLAQQEVRAVFKDTQPEETNVGVQVKQVSYTWSDAPDTDYIILEYHIRNVTEAPFEKLYTGLFADWDIGEYYKNAAGWDGESNLGYVYHVANALPYAGIKLLTHDAPIYYAIDNAIDSGGYTFNIEDNFTTEEKYTTLSGGVARTKAGGKEGANVSHVVGAETVNLAPGETKIIAFALLAADNLQNLKKHAAAAQQRYYSFRTSPAAVALADTACAGSTITWAPEGGSTQFNFYADAEKETLLSTGTSYTIDNFTQPSIVYAAAIDSLFEGTAVPATFSLPATPVADFEFNPAEVYTGTPVTFTNKSSNAKNWRWKIGSSVEPLTDQDAVYTFTEPGKYEVELTVSDRFDCSETSVTKTVEVLQASPTGIVKDKDKRLLLYPNPTTGFIRIQLGELANGQLPELTITDMLGRSVSPAVQLQGTEALADLSDLAAGVYQAHISLNGDTYVKRIVVIKP